MALPSEHAELIRDVYADRYKLSTTDEGKLESIGKALVAITEGISATRVAKEGRWDLRRMGQPIRDLGKTGLTLAVIAPVKAVRGIRDIEAGTGGLVLPTYLARDKILEQTGQLEIGRWFTAIGSDELGWLGLDEPLVARGSRLIPVKERHERAQNNHVLAEIIEIKKQGKSDAADTSPLGDSKFTHAEAVALVAYAPDGYLHASSMVDITSLEDVKPDYLSDAFVTTARIDSALQSILLKQL